MEPVETSLPYPTTFEIETNTGLVCPTAPGITSSEVCMKSPVSDNYTVYNHRVYIGDIREI